MIGLFITIAILSIVILFELYSTGAVVGVDSEDYSNLGLGNKKNYLELETQQEMRNRECPYDCCLDGQYDTKSCAEGYVCQYNMCIELDSDSDGLSDNEENKLGTSPKLTDSDFDGLTDYQEVRLIGTNPLSENSDNDRYNDKDDSEPLITNSALLAISFDEPQQSITDIVGGLSEVATNYANPVWWFELATTQPTKQFLVTIKNVGDDYTDHISFDVVQLGVVFSSELDGFLCSEKKKTWEGIVTSQSFSFDQRIMPRSEITIPLIVNVEFIDKCESILCSCDTIYGYELSNIKYEGFI